MDSNQIPIVSKGDLPQSLVNIGFWSSGLKEIDITDLNCLTFAELSQNTIRKFKHGNNPKLT